MVFLLPSGGLYNPYHLLGEPEKSIEKTSNYDNLDKQFGSFFAFFRHWNEASERGFAAIVATWQAETTSVDGYYLNGGE